MHVLMYVVYVNNWKEKKIWITWDDLKVLDEQETHGRWTHLSLHSEAFHQLQEPEQYNN